MFENTITTTLTAVGKIPDLLRSARAGSLIEYTKTTRVEPVVLVDQGAVALPYIHDVLQSVNSIFAGYYLQAVALSLNVGKVDTIRVLDKVNPARDPAENAGMFIGDMLLSEESYKYGLPVIGQSFGLEAYGDDKKQPVENSFGKDSVKMATEVANLSVGKLFDVHVESEGHKATIPVSVRLIVSAATPDNLVHILTVGSKDTSVKERYHAWRAGQLTFVKDLIMCQDLVDEHREALMKDATGQYASTLKRRDKNRLAAALSGSPSIATASNIYVLMNSTVSKLEGDIGGRLKDFKVRENIFKNTYIMLMVVIDPSWEQITIYHRSIDTPTQLSVKELKAANRGTGPDVAEILKAFQLGNAPTI